jgi:hypothetical protein
VPKRKQPESTGKIAVEEAAKQAMTYLAKLVPHPADIRIEEAELSEDERYWLITLSYYVTGAGLEAMLRRKEYKLFRVDASTGEVRSMKIREV